MDLEINRLLSILRNKGALVNGAPTSETFVSTTDSLEATRDALRVPGADSANNDNVSDVVGNKTDTNAGNSLLARNLVPTADVATNVNIRDVLGNKSDAAVSTVGVAASVLAYIKGAINFLRGTPRFHEVVIYPVAEDVATTTLTNDGSSPIYMPAAAASTAAVGVGAAATAWSEDINFEQEGTVSVISIYAEFEWQTRFLVGAGNGTNTESKMQISSNGGGAWTDLTDTYTHNAAVMTNRRRAGTGRWITAVTTGANQLQFRLLHWVDVGTGVSTSEAQIRSNSYVAIAYLKT